MGASRSMTRRVMSPKKRLDVMLAVRYILGVR